MGGVRYQSRGPGWRIHGGVEDTKLSTNTQHTLSLTARSRLSIVAGGRRPLRRCQWPLRGGGAVMVFGKAVPKGSPVIGRHTATATSGAHLPS